MSLSTWCTRVINLTYKCEYPIWTLSSIPYDKFLWPNLMEQHSRGLSGSVRSEFLFVCNRIYCSRLPTAAGLPSHSCMAYAVLPLRSWPVANGDAGSAWRVTRNMAISKEPCRGYWRGVRSSSRKGRRRKRNSATARILPTKMSQRLDWDLGKHAPSKSIRLAESPP